MGKYSYIGLFFCFYLQGVQLFGEESPRDSEFAKAVSQVELARAEADLELAKIAASLELAKAEAQVEVAKALANLELAKAQKEVEVVKVASQLNLVRITGEVECAKALGELELAKVQADLELAKVLSQVELMNAKKDLEVAKALAELNLLKAKAEFNKVKDEIGTSEEIKEEKVEEAISLEKEADQDNSIEKETSTEERVDEDREKETDETATEKTNCEEKVEEKTDLNTYSYPFGQTFQCSIPTRSKPFITKDFFLSVSEHFGKSLWANAPYTKVGVYSASDLCQPGCGLSFQEEACFFDSDCFANSIGFSVRGVDCKKRLFGFNVFYDYLHGNCRGLHQIGFGGECRVNCFDAYLNAFFPVVRESGFADKFFYNNYVGPYWVYVTPVDFLYRGVEFAVGKRGSFCKNFCVNGFLGGYYLESPFQCRTLGFQALGEISWCSRFFAGFFLTNDCLCGRLTEGYFGVSFPFSVPGNCCKSTYCCSNGCLRDGIIPRFSTGVRGCAAYYKKNW